MENLSVSGVSFRPSAPAVEGVAVRSAEQPAKTVSDGEKEPAAQPQQVEEAVKKFESFVKDIQRNLDFSVDDSSGQVVVKVVDGDSGKLIRQIPSEELLRLSERLEDLRSLLFSEKV